MLARGKLRESGELGDDVTIKTERGDRQFATGDRLMFLRNDRDLGVKNGSLGTIGEISPQRVSVMLDDGRNVTFDAKNYAHVDHGYAATIHKAQGVTIDRTHVLATPGMNRHLAYVSLSRHRESVSLHYGRNDFASGDQLARTLSRERAKDMASDYETARQFAERRGISFRECIAEVVRKIVPEKARSIFDNFRPMPNRAQEPAFERDERKANANDIQRGVERYGLALDEIGRTQAKGISPMPHQVAARDKAHSALDAMRPNAGRDLAAAFDHRPELIAEAASGRTNNAMRAMQLEAELRTNPIRRADRFVENWQRLDHQRDHAFKAGNRDHASQITARMGAMAGGLERDAQVDSLLRERKQELGLRSVQSGGISHQLSDYLGIRRTRDIGISM